MEINKLGEGKIIDLIHSKVLITNPKIVAGIGDDAAVIEAGDHYEIITTDMLVEGVHFSMDFTDAYHLGRKSLAVNLSDIAAMGGEPLYYLVSISLPGHTKVQFVEDFYQGMQDLALTHGAHLIGGDTVGAENKIAIAITVTGQVKKDEIIFRRGANPGDLVYVSGFLGDSAAGLKIMLAGLRGQLAPEIESYLIKRHIAPEPRLELGRILAINRLASALNDVSDGLVKKVWEIAISSQVAIKINPAAMPISAQLGKFSSQLNVPAIDFALQGGEDYELLFTVPPEQEARLAKYQLPVKKIGQVVARAKQGEVCDLDGHALYDEGFKHF
ncbi:MAG: Thiamine-monophosphate kinase [Pelotomaculum sp. PtaB.Bin104]|nr:MAG: Thiamine-monophosphate kinase [Pelotomaculum sp. PtaB.Bin104]